MPLFEQLSQAAAKRGLKFLVIGGHAVIAHGYARTTFDVDLFVEKVRQTEWKELMEALGYGPTAQHETFMQFAAPSPQAWPVDLMLVSPETFAGVWKDAMETPLETVAVRIPCLRHLLALKLHVLKQGLGHRVVKDLNDVVQLIELNRVEVRTEEFRQLCLRYGNVEWYERLVVACG
jgi:hypothetical protein